MSLKKTSLIFIVAIILLFSLASIALAAPPLQTPDDGSSTGDTLDLDNVKTNLGTVMSDKSGDEADDPAGEEPEGEEPEGDTPEGEEPEGDDPEGEEPEGDDELQEHPVASALAEYFGVDYDEVMGLHMDGNGFGNIVKAYFFADKLGMAPAEVLDAAHGSGWGNMLKENGLHPGNGNGADKEKKVPPGQAKKNNDSGITGELTGQDNANNGNGNQGGNGKDKNKDKGKGKGKNK
jgi:hypothetical protein